MEHPQILLSHLSMWGMPVSRIIEIAAKAGFDGVEIFLSNPVRKRIAYYRELTARYNMALHFHQFISYDEDPGHLIFRILGAINYLPQPGYTLDEHVPKEITEPVVVSADRSREAFSHSNYWLQTTSATDSYGGYKLEFCAFLVLLATHNDHFGSIVFDTQHLLEYRQGKRGIEHLSTDSNLLLKKLEQDWKLLDLNHSVQEMHLNNFDPNLGHTKGRNVLPDHGILPLKEFIAIVKQSGWAGGFITPEVSPIHMFPYSLDSAKRLLEATNRIIN